MQKESVSSGFPPYPWLWLLLSALVILLDWQTKQWASESLVLYRPHELFPGLNITLAHNYGAAFSFLISMVVMIVIGVGVLMSHRIHPFSRQYFLGLFVGVSFYYILFTIFQRTIGNQIHILITSTFFFISLFLYGFLLFYLNIFSQEEKFMILSWMRNRFAANKKSDIAKTL